ncbi:hypothetical protein V1515DRAFT_582858 [Lipomyces mesembrius]
MKAATVFTALVAALGATALPHGKSEEKHTEPTSPNGEPYIPGQCFDRFFMLVGSGHLLNLWKQAPNGRILANYYATTHPSQVSRQNHVQPNYFAHISGTSYGWNSDSPANITGADSFTIVDLMEEKGISWAGYAEDYPISQGCYTPYAPEYANGTEVPHSYVRKHFPFISMETIYTNKTRCNNLYNAKMFWQHLKENKLPRFVY